MFAGMSAVKGRRPQTARSGVACLLVARLAGCLLCRGPFLLQDGFLLRRQLQAAKQQHAAPCSLFLIASSLIAPPCVHVAVASQCSGSERRRSPNANSTSPPTRGGPGGTTRPHHQAAGTRSQRCPPWRQPWCRADRVGRGPSRYAVHEPFAGRKSSKASAGPVEHAQPGGCNAVRLHPGWDARHGRPVHGLAECDRGGGACSAGRYTATAVRCLPMLQRCVRPCGMQCMWSHACSPGGRFNGAWEGARVIQPL